MLEIPTSLRAPLFAADRIEYVLIACQLSIFASAAREDAGPPLHTVLGVLAGPEMHRRAMLAEFGGGGRRGCTWPLRSAITLGTIAPL